MYNLNNAKYCLANYTPIEDIADFIDVANAAFFLGTDLSKNTTGTELVVDGVKIGNLSVNTDAQWGTSVTNVQICNAGYQPKEFIAYVDNFIAYNGVTLMGDESVWTLS